MKKFIKTLQELKKFNGLKPLAIGLGITLFAAIALAAVLPSELEQREKSRAMAAELYSNSIVENQLATLELERISNYKIRTQATEITAGENFCFHHYRLVEQKKLEGLEVQNEECDLFHQ
jgi:hypothetical protein